MRAYATRPDNTNRDIAYKPEASPLYDLAGQPAGDKTDHQNNQQAFI